MLQHSGLSDSRVTEDFHVSSRIESRANRSDPLMPGQHRSIHVIVDIRKRMARCLSQGRARGESMRIPGKAKGLLL